MNGYQKDDNPLWVDILATVITILLFAAVAILFFLGLFAAVRWAGERVFSLDSPAVTTTSLPAEAKMDLKLPAPYEATISGPATVSALAVRLDPPAPAPTIPAFATDCEEMSWYRTQAGLPEVFDRIGWRESNCRNEDGVRTFCCYGWWQNYMSSHLSSQSAYRERIISNCGVTSYRDVNSDNPEDKWRQACVTYVVYSIERELGRSGIGPWS